MNTPHSFTSRLKKGAGAVALVASTLGGTAHAQTGEHFTCGHDHTKHYPTHQEVASRGGEFRRTDCDTIRTALISILPAPRTDNRDMFYEALQNVADQTDVEAIINVKHAQMDRSEIAPRLQEKLKTENIHPIFHSLDYDNMPPALADTLKSIIEEHAPDAIYLELPYDMPGNNLSVGSPGRGMMIIKSYNSNPMYKAVIGHELGHELGPVGHDDSMNNIMNSSLSGNTSPLFTEEDKKIINERYTEHLIETNPDRNCTTTSVDDLTGYEPAIRVYPNPVSSHLTLESITEPITSVRVYNQLGQLVTYTPRNTQQVNSLLDISLEEFAPGIVFVTIETTKGRTTKKVAIIR